MKRLFKKLVFGKESVRKIPFGLYRGLYLSIDPGCELQLYLGLYERETYRWLKQVAKEAQSGIDVGAGYGELTLWLLRQKDMKKVFAFEPDAKRWRKFEENLAANPKKSAVSLGLFRELFTGARASEILQMVPEPVLMKIDIDGGEYDLLFSLQSELQEKDVRILLEVHSEELNRSCTRLLEGMGYRVMSIRKAWWRVLLPEQRPLGFNQWLVALKK